MLFKQKPRILTFNIYQVMKAIMSVLFWVFLALLVTNTRLTQVTNEGSKVLLRITPEGSYLDSVLVDYSGVWSTGFEKNKFIPCENWTPDSLGGVTFIPNRLGLSNGEEVWEYIDKSYSDMVSFLNEKPENSSSDLFIKARGWLIGPGAYDHFGTNRYTIKTIKFDDVRWAIPKECEE